METQAKSGLSSYKHHPLTIENSFGLLRHLTRNRSLLRKAGSLKGLGHAILGNFSTDQMVIELTKI